VAAGSPVCLIAMSLLPNCVLNLRLTVIDIVDNSSNLAQKIHELIQKSIEHSNYKTLTVENAIDKIESILTLENTLNLQIKRTLISEQLYYRIFYLNSNKNPEC
jgi:hypothetical protein